MALTDDLERLASLHRNGALSDAEFASAKARALGTAPRADDVVQGLHALRRSRTDRWLGGVCGGLAPATGLPGLAVAADLRLAGVVRRHRPDALRAALDPVAEGGPRSRPRRRFAALDRSRLVRTLLALVIWCLLFVLCWPIALAALVLWPLVWLLTLPLRLIGIVFEALFAALRALLFLPARLLGARR